MKRPLFNDSRGPIECLRPYFGDKEQLELGVALEACLETWRRGSANRGLIGSGNHSEGERLIKSKVCAKRVIN